MLVEPDLSWRLLRWRLRLRVKRTVEVAAGAALAFPPGATSAAVPCLVTARCLSVRRNRDRGH